MPTVISGSTTLSALTTVSWGIMSLFLNNEPGGWYDPSDLTTLFQDAAGTTPVTAVEQPVGLVLDKSQGLVLGSEKWTGSPTLAANWSGSGGTYTSNGGTGFITLAAIASAYLTVGKVYKTSFTVSNVTAGSVSSPYDGEGTNGAYKTANGTYERIFRAAADGLYIYSNGFAGTVSNITVKEVQGNHLSQSTSTARPVLSARVNLLTRTEDFSNSTSWNDKTGSTPTANQTTDPLGGNTGNKLTETATTGMHYVAHAAVTTSSNVVYRALAYFKKGTARYAGLNISAQNSTDRYAVVIDLETGLFTSKREQGLSNMSYSILDAGNGWWRLSLNGSGVGAQFFVGIFISDAATPADWGTYAVPTYAGNTNNFIYIWGADLRPANAGVGLPAYQRVTTATDYDTTGFPLYLKFDGTDDSLSSASIDFTSTDKMSVFAGVRKLSDAALGMLVELSANYNSNNGSFYLIAPLGTGSDGDYRGSSRGNASPAATQASRVAVLAPDTAVITTQYGISDDLSSIRRNGLAGTSAIGDQGTGNYGNYPLYVGSRGGEGLRFNGYIYSLIVRGAATDAATIASTETWVNSKTKAY